LAASSERIGPAPSSPRACALVETPLEGAFLPADVAILLPTLNEEKGLARTLAEIPMADLAAANRVVRPIVIDGGSTDGTVEVARAAGVPVLRQTSRGKGGAIREALHWLHRHGVEYVVVMDADWTYPATMIPSMVQLLASGSRLVIGVREPVAMVPFDPREFVHRVGNRLLNLSSSELAGLPILDLCSGFWGVWLPMAMSLDLVSDGFEIEAELFVKAFRRGHTVTQVPVAYRERVGQAKLHAVRDGVRIFLTSLRFGRQSFGADTVDEVPTLARDILCVALVEGSAEFDVVFHPLRQSDAEDLAQRLRASRPGCRVLVHQASSSLPPSSASVTIALPATPDAARPGLPLAFVHLARTRRIVGLLNPVRIPADWHRAEAEASAGVPSEFQLEYAPDQWTLTERLRAIVTNAFPHPILRELAFLGANGHHGSMAVWRSEQAGLPPWKELLARGVVVPPPDGPVDRVRQQVLP
jgi:hypothetical protein